MSSNEQADWLAGAIEAVRQNGKKRTRKSYGIQDAVNRMIAASPRVRRIQVLASRDDVRRFAAEVSAGFMYRGYLIVPVRHRDPNRTWLGVVPV